MGKNTQPAKKEWAMSSSDLLRRGHIDPLTDEPVGSESVASRPQVGELSEREVEVLNSPTTDLRTAIKKAGGQWDGDPLSDWAPPTQPGGAAAGSQPPKRKRRPQAASDL